jgi:SpoVK/Ycf46/Vps4 family AAA+-type ATPase
MSSTWTALVANLKGGMGFVSASFKRTPLFVWVYMALMVWLYKRMVKDFLKSGTTKKRLLGRKNVALTHEEETIAEGLVGTDKLTQTFASVGGLQHAKDILQEHVVWPFRHPELYSGSLCQSPSGVLLYGPPGTGKTLLARALAKELDCFFISVSVETLFSKYVGESEKLVAAIFTLARKCQPCVIFVDEIDSLLAARSSSESEAYMHAKTIFLTQWDGIVTGSNVGDRIIVVGATNRMEALDEAVLRRLSIRVEVPPPDRVARQEILRLLLSEGEGVNLADDVNLEDIASWTEGYTGSDLKELCKAAVVLPRKEMMKGGASGAAPAVNPQTLAVRQSHFLDALKRIKPTPQATARRAAMSPLFQKKDWTY